MTPLKLSDIRCPSFYKSLLHRFLLGILDRCNYIRVGNDRVSITSEIRRNILEKVKDYGTGRDTLRCLAVATVDDPVSPSDMDLSDSTKFAQYEVRIYKYYKA